jgi:hypothetical protein
MDPKILELLEFFVPLTAIAISLGMLGWTVNTWLRIKHGYPLEGGWGQAVYPKTDREGSDRIRLLVNENAQLREELGSLKDRLETVERIVTDQPSKLARDIDALTIDKGGNA